MISRESVYASAEKRDDNARCLLANEAGVPCLVAISAKIENCDGALPRGRRALARFSRLDAMRLPGPDSCLFLSRDLLSSEPLL